MKTKQAIAFLFEFYDFGAKYDVLPSDVLVLSKKSVVTLTAWLNYIDSF